MRKPVVPPIRTFWYGLATGFLIAHCVVLIEAVIIRVAPWMLFVDIMVLGAVGCLVLWKISNDNDQYDMVGPFVAHTTVPDVEVFGWCYDNIKHPWSSTGILGDKTIRFSTHEDLKRFKVRFG